MCFGFGLLNNKFCGLLFSQMFLWDRLKGLKLWHSSSTSEAPQQRSTRVEEEFGSSTSALLFYLGGAAVEEHTHTHTHTSEKGERERAIAIAIAIGLRSRRDAAVNEATINLVYFGSRRRRDATVDKICSPHVYCGSRSLPQSVEFSLPQLRSLSPFIRSLFLFCLKIYFCQGHYLYHV